MSDDCAGSYHRKAANGDPCDNNSSSADGSAIVDKGGDKGPITCFFKGAIGKYGAWIEVIGKTDAWPNKNAIGQGDPMIDETIILNLDVIADHHVGVDIDIFADNGICADDHVFANLHRIPDARAHADGGVGRDISSGVNFGGAE